MDAFFLEQDKFVPQHDQNIQFINEQNQIQNENIFGIRHKENMFDDPCTFAADLSNETEEHQIIPVDDESCEADNTTQVVIASKSVEFPPCRCYRINCQKKYCECFRNGRKCTKRCICIDCHNQPLVTRLKVNVEQLWQVSYMFNTIKRRC